MQKAVHDILLLLLLAAGGAALALAAGGNPAGFSKLAGWVAVAGFGMTVLVVSGSFRGKGSPLPGLLPLIAGFLLLAGGALADFIPDAAQAVADGVTGGTISAEAVPTLLHASGALGIAMGFLFWTNGLIRRAVDAEDREVEAKSQTEELEDVLRVQGRELEEALTVDPGTGVLNRRAFLERLEESIRRDSRLRRPMAFVLIEVIDLPAEAFEDWRPGDDTMLRIVAKSLLSSTRGTDHVGRITDDRFAVVLGECEDPRPAVDRMLLTLESEPEVGEENRKIRVRVGTVRIPQPTLVSTREMFQIAAEAVDSLRGTTASLCAHRTYGERSTTSRVSTVT